MEGKKRVLFLCIHNSARSQMAEGLLNALYGDAYEAYSAGIKPLGVNPYAIRVMKEIGIDISHHCSKGVEEFLGQEFDYVVTVCGGSPDADACPFFPGGKNYIHKGFEDPAQASGSEEDIMRIFRRVRDEIKEWIIEVFGKGKG